MPEKTCLHELLAVLHFRNTAKGTQ